MDASDKPNSAHMSRDFWMPDHSCLVCYECDLQFSLFNRRHHCRLCGKVFCAKCTSNFIPVTSSDQGTTSEERIRVCNFCFEQREQGLATANDHAIQPSCLDVSVSSPSVEIESDYGVGNSKSMSAISLPNSFDLHASEEVHKIMEEVVTDGEQDELPCLPESIDTEPIDFENNGMLWFPPEPEDEEDEREAYLFDDDNDDDGDGDGHHLALETSFLADEGASLPQLLSSAQVDGKQVIEEPASLTEEFVPSPSDIQGILVSLSSRCVWNGTVCERSHLVRIKYYSNFDKPLGRYLCDNLFEQGFRCRFCEMPSEAHVQCYTHRQGTLTISVKKLPQILLPGEKDGKIWMWHRCLRCPRSNGFPPATRRIVMSDDAWGLSFGKFLELSFSNHAAASRVASCGHSLHRDCLRFYGFGQMVACFRYASIDVHSVYLPPSKLDFNYENQDWIENELNQVVGKAALMFSDVVNSLLMLEEKISGIELPNSMKISNARSQIADLESMLQKEKDDFEKLVKNIKNKEMKKGQPALDILEINRLRRQLLFQSYKWDRCLEYAAATMDNKTSQDDNQVQMSSVQESEGQGGLRYMFPVWVNDAVVPVYDDEPSSIISYALLSHDYLVQISDEIERSKDAIDSMGAQHVDQENQQLSQPADEAALQSYRSLVGDESLMSTGSHNSAILDPHSHNKTLHAKVLFDHPLGNVKYNVTCYCAKSFEALRRICCPSEMDFVRSLSRCKKEGTQGEKGNVFFAKTLDERFIIKQVTKTELESFLKFAPEYFKYLSESIVSGRPTCLAKVLGIYQVTTKSVEGGKELKMDLLVMENHLYGRNLTRIYNLKGSTRSRYNPDSSGNNKVLLDQNLIEAMPTSPIYVGNKAKRLLERAVWDDTAFLASVDVMNYSLLVGIDEEKHELVLGIINFMRPYTWDKQLETYVKASGILGGPKNASPTVIPPKEYKERFRKAMNTYFLMLPDQWSPPTIIPSMPQADLAGYNAQDSYLDEPSPCGPNASDVASSSLTDKVQSFYQLVVNRILHCIYG